jgi:hypothetical protein
VQGEFQFAVRVDDRDSDTDDLLDRVIVNLQLAPRSTFTGVTRTGRNEVVTMGYNFRVQCEANYFGSDCTVFCTSDQFFTCDSNGRRVCSDGYSGSDCRTRMFSFVLLLLLLLLFGRLATFQ